MSQSTAVITTGVGAYSVAAALVKIIANFAASWSLQSGPTAPANPPTYLLWLDTGAAPVLKLKFNNGTPSVPAWVEVTPDMATAGGGLLKLAGGTMSGPINMGSQRLTNLGTATATTDAPTVAQVNGHVQTAIIRIPGFNASVDEPVLVAPAGFTLLKAWVICDTATAGSGAGTRWDFQLRNVGVAGAGTTDMLTAAFTTNGSELAANDSKDLGAIANPSMAEGEGMLFRVTKTGSPTSLATAKFTLILQSKVAIV